MAHVSVGDRAKLRGVSSLEQTVALQGEILREILELLRHSKLQFSTGEFQKLAGLLERLSPKA